MASSRKVAIEVRGFKVVLLYHDPYLEVNPRNARDTCCRFLRVGLLDIRWVAMPGDIVKKAEGLSLGIKHELYS